MESTRTNIENTQALRFAAEKAPDADLYRSDICDPVLHQSDLDFIISMDVI
jgi:hypothetical protein